jgi:hypothetical protein
MLATMSLTPTPPAPAKPPGEDPTLPAVAQPPNVPAEERAPPSSQGEDDERRPFTWRAVIGLIVLALAGWFVLQNLVSVTRIQDCVWSGRRNCAPVDDPNPR